MRIGATCVAGRERREWRPSCAFSGVVQQNLQMVIWSASSRQFNIFDTRWHQVDASISMRLGIGRLMQEQTNIGDLSNTSDASMRYSDVKLSL